MTTTRVNKILLVKFFIVVGIFFAVYAAPASAQVGPGNIGPKPSDAEPYNNSNGNNNVNYIVGNADYIRVMTTHIQIYASTQNINVDILGADLCRSDVYSSGTRDVRNSGANGIPPGAQVATFTLNGKDTNDNNLTTQIRYGNHRISDGFCESNNNTTRSFSATSQKSIPTRDGPLYVYTLTARWDAGGLCSAPDCGVNAFRVVARNSNGTTNRVYVSQAGATERTGNASDYGMNVGFHSSTDNNNPQDEYKNTQDNDFTDFMTYFGPPCNITGSSIATIEIFDDDNGRANVSGFNNFNGAQSSQRPFMVLVEESPKAVNSWSRVNFMQIRSSSPGTLNKNYDNPYSSRIWRVIGHSNSGQTAYLDFNIRGPDSGSPDGYKYRFRVAQLDWNNNIQFQLPYPGFWSAEVCSGDWELSPRTRVDKNTMYVGQTATFTHDIDHVGGPAAPAGQALTVAQTRTGFGNSIVSPRGLRTPLIPVAGTHRVQGSYSYTAQANDIGRTICQSVNVNRYIRNGGSKTSQPPGCVTVTAMPDRTVKIQPYANNSGETEADNPVSFNGGAVVSDFPNTTDWGYNDQSQQLAAYRVTAQPGASVESTTETTGASGGPYTYCSNGGSVSNGCYIPAQPLQCLNAPGYPATAQCPADKYPYYQSESYGYTITWWSCPSGYYSNNNGTCSRTVYRCAQTGGAYSPNYPSCRTYYTCEGNVPNTGWHYTQPLCNRWKCQYGDTPNYDQTNQPTCEFRCNGGRASVSDNPGRAPLATGQYYGNGDRNCYTRPTFTLTCQWTNQAGNQIYSSHTSIVTSNGNWCQSTENRPPGNIGDEICISYKANNPGTNNWNTSPRPGIRNGASFQNWGYSVGSPVTACMKIVGKPYVRVVGGDVTTGIGAGLTAATCMAATGQAQINTQNKDAAGGYAGSGASVTALARGTINGFASGQFANSKLGNAPTALTFANNSGTFGGNWGSSVACVDASKFTPTSTTFDIGNGNGNYSVTNTQKIKVTNQNVFIGKNISYAGAAWGSLEQIPLYQLMVVGGDIYISGDVSQLDGLYAAVENNGVGGNIYTCASSAGANITQTFTGQCNRQLVVNGSFVAKKVHLTRDCATLNRSSINETTVFSGGGDAQQCTNNGTKASEVFNYLPDQWIRSSIGVPGSSYDAVTTMPPIL